MRIRSTEEQVYIRDLGGGLIDAPQHDIPDDPISGPGAVPEVDGPLDQLVRSLRLSISASVQSSEVPARSIAVVGLDAAREAAIIAASLGTSYAYTGVTTIIVDGAVVNPMQHSLLGTPAGRAGLSSVMSGEKDARTASLVTSVRNLSLLPAGPSPSDTPILFDSERFHGRVMPLLDWHDMLIVDGGDAASDAPPLCEIMDGIILAVRQNVTEIGRVSRIVAQISAMGTKLVGIVVSA